tara:strand:- start:1137 stop:1838 length:702 start_codon:yes stop_codon:yes gene_type:complete
MADKKQTKTKETSLTDTIEKLGLNEDRDWPDVSKGKFLIDSEDEMKRGMPQDILKELALSISIDMYEIHQKINDKMERFDILVDYFTERQGIWDEECKKPEEMALKMVLMGEVADVSSEIITLTDCKPKDFRISFEISEDSGIAVTVGIHKSVKKNMRKILDKLVNIHVAQMLQRMKHEYPRLMMHVIDANDKEGLAYAKELIKKNESKAEIDDEARKVLDRMQWDKTSMGEA